MADKTETAEKTDNTEKEVKKISKLSDKSVKLFFIRYGIFTGILAVVFLFLIYSILISKKSWNYNLKTCVEKVLDESEPNMWSVENYIQINNPFTMNASCYEARYRKTGELYRAVIIRTATFYGPQNAVFICDKDENVSFVGYSSLHSRIGTQLMNNTTDLRLNYWKKRIPEILK